VDVALTGSQKALSTPTGMGIVCASPKAIEASKTARSLRVFFDWKDYLGSYQMGTYTPSIQLLYGLRAALDLLCQEGLENVFKRHNRLGTATRYCTSTTQQHCIALPFLLLLLGADRIVCVLCE
jgi:alanine-glyoxylate transaminase / serine-glyoxylate transaminase / serine-pyruvate transaminase